MKVKLTPMQTGWLCAIKATPCGISRMAIATGEGGSIASLVKRGLAEWNGRTFLTLTDAGRAAVQDYELCRNCQEVTHVHEAACIYCGKSKDWA